MSDESSGGTGNCVYTCVWRKETKEMETSVRLSQEDCKVTKKSILLGAIREETIEEIIETLTSLSRQGEEGSRSRYRLHSLYVSAQQLDLSFQRID